MIKFKTLRFKNFLSYGNIFTEIPLNEAKTTLVVGQNGSGKSAMLDALCFVLYGKPFRNINKPQLVNSITQKHCVVECEFTVNGKPYLIRRGIKPELFEIYQNGTLVNQSSNTRDYQETLEKNILKINFKSFSQIVILGSANFVPFMQLPAQARREVIEDLLDIQIFSLMNVVLKDKIAANRAMIDRVENEIAFLEREEKLHKNHVKTLEETNKEYIQKKQTLLLQIESDIGDLSIEQQKILTSIEEKLLLLTDHKKCEHKRSEMADIQRKLDDKQKLSKKEIAFYTSNDNCPTCKQNIDAEFKNKKITTRNEQLEMLRVTIEKLQIENAENERRLKEIAAVNLEISTMNKKASDVGNKIYSFGQNKKMIEQEIASFKEDNRAIEDIKERIQNARSAIEKTTKQKDQLNDDRRIYEISTILLKDGGIKTKIIRQYVPIINRLVNKYLSVMDFFVQFELNENFKETIKSRHRDDFTYASFSEGEKARLDLALLFTWRALAKLRNSATTNLLILDEVFDSSLDESGNDFLFDIISQMDADANVFCISHKGDKLYDKFETVIKFEKVKNFSQMKTEKA